MRRGIPVLSLLLALLFAACQAPAKRSRAKGFPVPVSAEGEAGARVEVEVDGPDLVLRFRATVVDRWGVWLEDGAGTRVEPGAAFDADGALVELGGAASARVQTVAFPLELLQRRPWTLRVLPRGAPAWRVVLAEVEREALGGPCEVFGYARETWHHPDGARTLTYARRDPAGERVEVPRARFEEDVRPSVVRAVGSLPGTLGESVAGCPAVAETIARGFEGGALYRGPGEGRNFHPHARGQEFWSPPRFVELPGGGGSVEDPIDTLVWFLVELFNASSADSYRRIWQGVLDGSLSEEQYVTRETLQKAAQVRRAVQTIQAHGACLGLAEWREHGARVFSEYERWVDSSGGDLRVLARTILRNPARYTLSPAEAGLTYGERLRGLYREHAPISAVRSGW